MKTILFFVILVAMLQNTVLFSQSLPTGVGISFAPSPTAIIPLGNTVIYIGDSVSIPVILTGGSSWDITYSDGNMDYTVKNIKKSPYYIKVNPSMTTGYFITSVVNEYGCYGVASGYHMVMFGNNEKNKKQ